MNIVKEILAGTPSPDGKKRVIVQGSRKDVSGPFAQLLVNYPRCVICTTVVRNAAEGQKEAICDSCKTNPEACRDACMTASAEASKWSEEYRRLWTRCQDCQKSHFNEVICGNNDCPIFFRRLTARKKANRAMERLQQFSELF